MKPMTHFKGLLLAAPAIALLSLSGCGNSSGLADGGDLGGGSNAPILVSLDGGGETGTTDTYAADLGSRTASFDTGLNEGIALGGTRLTAVGVVNGLGTVRRFADFTARGTAAFDPMTDTEVAFNQFRAPKGVALVGVTRNLIAVADAPAAVSGEVLATVPSLHLLTTTLGLMEQPALLTTVSVSAAGGRTWDIAYDGPNDRLYAAMTNGVVAVYDSFTVRGLAAGLGGPALTPDRRITPGAVVDGVSVKRSVNLHGISYSADSDQLVVSDVGLADSDSDGALFVIDAASTAADTATGAGAAIVVPTRTLVGAASKLGNPVDILLRSDGRLYVAEKLNGGGQILVFDGILSGSSGDVAPDASITTDALGSSGDPESITEPG